MLNDISSNTRVVHITTVHAPFDQRIFHRECYSIAKAGYDVTLLTHHVRDEIREGVKLVSLGAPYLGKAKLRLLDRWLRTRIALRIALSHPADIYHFHDPELIGVALEMKRRTSARIIYDCHEDNIGYALQKRYIPRYLRFLMAKIIEIYECKAARCLDAIVVADEGVRQRFADFGAKSEIIYNFPRLELFGKVARDVPRFDLVYHGTLPKYHIELCLAIDDAIVQRGRYVRWLLFGRISNPEWVKHQIIQRNASERIVIGGMVPHDDVAKVVSQASIGIIPLPDLPKFQHNIPTKLFEFMALGLPVILSDLPPSRPFVGDNLCGYMVPVDDIGAYADAIIQLLDDPALRFQMGNEGRKRVERQYNWGGEASKLLNLYKELMAS